MYQNERPTAANGRPDNNQISTNSISASSRACNGFLIESSTSVEKDYMLHATHNNRWIGLLSKPYIQGGVTSYVPIIEFTSKEARSNFQQQLLAALDRHLASSKGNA